MGTFLRIMGAVLVLFVAVWTVPAEAQGNARIDQNCRINLDCASGACVSNRCVCTEDRQCGGDEYCIKGMPGHGDNKCDRKRRNGDNCTRKEQCESGRCNLGKCKPPHCKSDKDCGDLQYCDKGTLGVGVNQCLSKRGNMKECTRRGQCASDRCEGGYCLRSHECRENEDCPSGAYCDKGTAGVGRNTCKLLKNNGQSCTAGKQCKSGRCHALTCKKQDECAKDSDCSNSQYCDKGTLTVGVNECVPKKSNGQGCTRKEQCTSGRCNVGFCAAEKECSKDSDCIDNRYCDKGTLGVGKNECTRKKSEGDACSRGGQCFSGCCKLHNFKVQCRPSNKCN